MKKEWMEFKDKDEEEKFNESYPGKKLETKKFIFSITKNYGLQKAI